MTRGPLAGIRIADFTWIGAGALMTRAFADFGADVIKIESSRRPDGLRMAPPFKDGVPGPNRSGYFANRNASKRSITVDLKRPEGRQVALDLIAQSDIVANNFSPGAMERLGLGYSDLRKMFPQIVYVAMSMQGASGPRRHYMGYGLTIAALSGLHALTSYEQDRVVGVGTNYPDHVPSPLHAAIGALAGLAHRDSTGRGCAIDVSQVEAMAALLGPEIWLESAFAQNPPVGNASGTGFMQDVFRGAAEDRWIAVSLDSSSQIRSLSSAFLACELGGFPPETPVEPAAVRTFMTREIGDCDDLLSLERCLQSEGIAASRVLDAADVLEDKALNHRRHWVYLEHPEMGRTVYGAQPARLSATKADISRVAPLLGEHTDEVLADLLGYSLEHIADLRSRGVLS